MAISKDAVTHYWNYFRSLCKRLECTKQYIDHSIDKNDSLKYGKVNSWEFQQILLLSAMEFENVCKQLCLHFDSNFNIKHADIKKISKTILDRYPRIGGTKIETDYQTLYPLSEWKIVKEGQDDKERVFGLTWWDDYCDLKHQTFQSFHLATLENAVNALSSLMVIELYVMKEVLDSVNITLGKQCDYFFHPYTSKYLCTHEIALPDFEGNKDIGPSPDGVFDITTVSSKK